MKNEDKVNCIFDVNTPECSAPTEKDILINFLKRVDATEDAKTKLIEMYEAGLILDFYINVDATGKELIEELIINFKPVNFKLKTL